MSGSDVPVLIAILGLFTAIAVQAVIAFLNQQEAKRKERYEYLTGLVKSLIDIRGEIQWAQSALDGKELVESGLVDPKMRSAAFERLQIALGKAHALMISVDDEQIRRWGDQIMDKNKTPSEQNELIRLALKRLGQLYGVLKTTDFDSR